MDAVGWATLSLRHREFGWILEVLSGCKAASKRHGQLGTRASGQIPRQRNGVLTSFAMPLALRSMYAPEDAGTRALTARGCENDGIA
mmetsp:Transcript_37550/g.86725  ORF Transcript_37550/g.86725 Transcript_37550/m.86725 type:complete len:87 (+) Transcript_37550:628-888(+)